MDIKAISNRQIKRGSIGLLLAYSFAFLVNYDSSRLVLMGTLFLCVTGGILVGHFCLRHELLKEEKK